MAGGKETPRQKMIGMMYLVLTALLALNVSKSILDAFVAIEENTQKSNIAQHDRGSGFKDDVNSEIKTTPNNAENKLKLEKLAKIMTQMNEVDKITANMIEQIDKIKLDILEKSGEDVKTVKDNDEQTIIWKKYDKAKAPCVPIRMHLMAVQAKDQYDVPMHEIIGQDIKKPTGSGKKLWDDFLNYRSKLVEIVGTYQSGEKSFSIKPKAINDFKTNQDLTAKVKKMVEESKADVKEDGQVLQDIYINLTKPERLKVNDMDGIHWIGATFDHSPLVAAVASLSSMQQDILSARAMALAHLKSKVTTGEYSFNKIMPLAYGPMIANTGDEVEVQVMMAAFDSDNQPTVTYGGQAVSDVQNGFGLVKTKVSGSGEMVLKGTVSIKNKSGVPKTENWTHTIKIMKPEGTVTLPEMNVLYRGYPNVVTGVASGYDQTVLSGGGNVDLSKNGTSWIGKPGAAATAKIIVSGKSSITNKTVQLGSFEFRVKALPKPSIFVGSTAGGGKISSNPGGLNAGYPPEIPLRADFKVLSWEASVAGIMGKVRGDGASLNGVSKLFGQGRSGTLVTIEANVKGPDNKVNTIYESFKLN